MGTTVIVALVVVQPVLRLVGAVLAHQRKSTSLPEKGVRRDEEGDERNAVLIALKKMFDATRRAETLVVTSSCPYGRS